MAKTLLLVLCIIPSLALPAPDVKEKRSIFHLFEGDLMLTEDEINAAEHSLDVDAAGHQGAVSRNRAWPEGVIPYTIHESAKNSFLNKLGLKGPTEKAIDSAIKEWEEKVCVHFVPRTTQTDYIEFFSDSGCYSYVGRVGGKQRISLGFGCFYHGIAVHEIGHALGFWHEQSRPDRDSYVKIIWENIKEDNKHNFNKYGQGRIDSMGVPYDYGSIMHYGKRDFAKWPWQTTIQTLRSGVSIGQRNHLSPLDVKQARLYYQCDK